MKLFVALMMICLLLVVGCSNDGSAPTGVSIASPDDSISYALGYQIGLNMQSGTEIIDESILIAGMKDALAKGSCQIGEENVRPQLQAFQRKMSERQQAEAAAVAEANKDAEAQFLAANKEKEGVVQLPSGLQYKVVTEGKGPKPKAEDKVRVHYTGRLIDGTKFDSSYDTNKPAEFQVRGVIKGWTEALQLMPVGSKWELYIPARLAYGARARGQHIKPHSMLVFDIELLDIVAE